MTSLLRTRSFVFGFCSFFSLFLFAGSISLADSTGDLQQIFTTQSSVLDSAYASTYQTVFSQIQSSGTPLINSLTYQSLLCLGVVKTVPVVKDIQQEGAQLVFNYKKELARIDADIDSLLEKDRIQRQTGISLYKSGSSYQKEYQSIVADLSGVVSAQQALFSTFKQTNLQKIATIATDISDYSSKNAATLTLVSDKLSKLIELSGLISNLPSVITNVQYRLLGDERVVFDRVQKLKENALLNLSLSLQDLSAGYVKRAPILKTFSGELESLKAYSLGLYGLAFDEQYQNLLAPWYDVKSYNQLLQQYELLQKMFVVGGIPQCSLIMAQTTTFDTQIVSLKKSVLDFQAKLASGSVSSSGFKEALTKWYSSFSTTTLSQKKQEFITAALAKKDVLLTQYKLQNTPISSTGTLASGTVVLPTPSTPVVVTGSSFIFPLGFSFKKPFSLGQKHADILMLQRLLQEEGYYTGALNSQYTKITKNAVYKFQLANNLLVGYEKRPQTWGWMGPATRTALNVLLSQ